MLPPQLLLLTGATLAMAAVNEEPGAQLEQRDDAECESVALRLYPVVADVPLITDPALVDFIASQTHFLTVTDPCVVPAATGSLSAEYMSWASELASWQQEHKSDLSSLIDACSDAPSYQDMLSSLGPAASTVCDSIRFETAVPTGTSDNEDDGEASGAAESGDSPSNSDNAGPRETGMVVAAVAVAAGHIVAGLL